MIDEGLVNGVFWSSWLDTLALRIHVLMQLFHLYTGHCPENVMAIDCME